MFSKIIGPLLIASMWGASTGLSDEATCVQRTSQQAESAPRSPDPVVEMGLRRHPEAVRREECFPLESLPPEIRQLSEELLLDALDSEALYSIVGGIKPVSEGFFGTHFSVDPPDLKELDRVRQALSAWRCGQQFQAGVLVFQNLHQQQRYASAWIANRSQLKRMLAQQQAFFGRLGLGPDTPATEVLLNVERSPDSAERWRGFGHLFGYPEPAIDFFVKAGVHQAQTGEFVKRDFRHYPMHAPDEDPARMVLRELTVQGSRFDSFSHLLDGGDAPISFVPLKEKRADADGRGDMPVWLRQSHFHRTIGAVFRPSLARSESYYEDIVLPEHYEAIIHIRQTTRARPLRPQPRFRFGARWETADSLPNGGRLAQAPGVIVKSVDAGSVAETCGLQAGDRVLQLAGAAIAQTQDFQTLLAKIDRPGPFELTIRRADQKSEQAVELTLYPVAPAWLAE